MKAHMLLPFTVLIIGALIFGMRRTKLEELKDQFYELKHKSVSDQGVAGTAASLSSSTRPLKDVEALRETAASLSGAAETHGRLSEDDRASFYQKLERFKENMARLSLDQALRIFSQNDSLVPPLNEESMRLMLRVLEEVNPACYLDLMVQTDIVPFSFNSKNGSLVRTLVKWGHKAPEDAYAWHQHAIQKGNPFFKSEEYQAGHLKIIASMAPNEALSKLLERGIQDGVHRFGSGGLFSPNDPNLDQISRVLRAFDDQGGKHPGSRQLERIRRSYIDDISASLFDRGWQEARPYMENHFSEKDLDHFFWGLNFSGSNWSSEWMDFATAHGEVDALEGLVQRWARKDPTTAGEWLTRQKASERKDAAIIG